MFDLFGRGPKARYTAEELKQRLPPGQSLTEKWPVLHSGPVPRRKLEDWTFRVWGLVEKPLVSQFWSSGGGAAVLPHTLVLAGKGSSFNYVDEFLSPDLDRPGLTSGSAEVALNVFARFRIF